MKKKIVLLLLMGLIIPFMVVNTTYALGSEPFEVDSEDIYVEPYIQVNDAAISSNHYSTGYTVLNMGLGNTIDLNLASSINSLPYYDGNKSNINNIYLIVELDNYYTSAEDPYWNYTDGNITTVSQNVLKYDLNESDFNGIVTFSFWWAENPSLGGGGAPLEDTGSIRFISAKLYVEYSESIYTIDYDDYINCESNYSLLPNTNEVFVEILNFSEYDATNHSHHIKFMYENDIYSFDLAIPSDIYDYDYLDLDGEVVKFKDFEPYQLSYASDEDGNKVVYIQPIEEYSGVPAENSEGVKRINGFATINLTTMEYKVINKLDLVGIVNKEANRYATLYCFFPLVVEDLLSITVSYDYRINSIFSKGDWQSAQNSYVNGDSYDGNSPSWWWWVPGFGWGWILGSAITGNSIYDIDDVIIDISGNEVPDEVVYKYENELGGLESDFNEMNLYKVSLGQFQDGFFTSWSDENAYDIQDLVILNILYEFDGVVYTASTPEIEQIIIDADLSAPSIIEVIDDNTSAIKSTAAIIFVAVVVIYGLSIWNKRERNYKTRINQKRR